MRDGNPEEFGIFVDRFMNFMNLWTIYRDLLSGRYIPSVGGVSLHQGGEGTDPPGSDWPTSITMMLILYAYFYSLVEDSEEGMNGFRVWRARHPEEESAIAAVETQVAPFLERLRWFRNRLGFHGSRSRTHEARGFELFAEHSGTEVLNAIKNFKALGAALFAKENAEQGLGSDEHARRWIDRVSERARQDLSKNSTRSG